MNDINKIPKEFQEYYNNILEKFNNLNNELKKK